jgi:hypothetical protein
MGYDMDIVRTAIYDESPESRLSRVTGQIFQGIMPSGYTTSTTHNEDNQQIDLYHHYTRIDGDMYMISLCETRKKICRIEEIDPVYKDEKLDKNSIPFPVALYYFFPIKYDPYGINMIDMAESEHRYLNELMNLMYIREKDAAL